MSWWIAYEWDGQTRRQDSYVIVKADALEQARQRVLAAMSLEAVGERAWLAPRYKRLSLEGRDPVELAPNDARIADVPEGAEWLVHMPAEGCRYCAGRGWVWRPPALTAPRQASDWFPCHQCNGTGWSVYHSTSPRQPKPTEPPLS
ncbi:hypothetical protein [Conexibacter sp. S30A1]|uniref:hypothetical protein n=1 Tax=Conexibacter sp. S30A1 TaxID=2937800 RepID=UPI00200C7692|nr:hypothetical protein [Conexibacter sp. S30A1]